jgi:hypothetical protein
MKLSVGRYCASFLLLVSLAHLLPSAMAEIIWTSPTYAIGVDGLTVTKDIDTSSYGDVTMSVNISHKGKLEASGGGKDYVQIFYKIDDGPEEKWLDIAGEQYSITAEVTVASGSQLKIRTVGDTTHSSEVYYVSLVVSGVAKGAPIPAPTVPMPVVSIPAPVEVPQPVPVPAPATAPSLEPSAGPSSKPSLKPVVAAACDVPWTGLAYTIDQNGFSKTDIIDTSCLDDITIAVRISHKGSLETSGGAMDYVQIYYQADDAAEKKWLAFTGDQYNSMEQVTLPSPSQLKIRTVGDTTAGDEFYYVNLWVIVPGAPIPTPAPIAAPIAPVQVPVAPAPIGPIPPAGTCPNIQVRDLC